MSQPLQLPTLAPTSASIRTAAIWVPDWPVIAAMRVADLSPHLPAAVMSPQHRVVAASAAARATGVRRGMRKRTAQGHCPSLVLLAADEARDAAQFEPVAVAVEEVVSGLEVMRPGIVLLPADGAARFYGSESELVSALMETVSEAGFECQIGLADGILAAVLAAREDSIIAPGGSPEYLAPKPIADLLTVAVGPQLTYELTEVISLWERLGVKTLRDLVALPCEAVAGRFGQLGVWAQRLARGLDLRPPCQQRPDEDIVVTQKFDPPLYRVEAAVAVGQNLAAEFVDLMMQRSLACGRVRISASTDNGIRSRVWRTDDGAIGGMDAASIAQRLRWQLDGWLTQQTLSRRQPPDDVIGGEYSDVLEGQPAPILALEIAAEELAPASTYQMSLWGGASGQDVRARRALSNVQGFLGLDQVQAVTVRGERTPWAREVRFTFGEPTPSSLDTDSPWPSALPDPAPTIVFPSPLAAKLFDQTGGEISVNLRTTQLIAAPIRFIADGLDQPVINWAGPWVIPQNWWDNSAVVSVYVQIVAANGLAYLLQHCSSGWEVCGIYE